MKRNKQTAVWHANSFTEKILRIRIFHSILKRITCMSFFSKTMHILEDFEIKK